VPWPETWVVLVVAAWPRLVVGGFRPWTVVTVGLVELVLPLEGTLVLVAWLFTGVLRLDVRCFAPFDAGRVVALCVLVERDEGGMLWRGFGLVVLVGRDDGGRRDVERLCEPLLCPACWVVDVRGALVVVVVWCWEVVAAAFLCVPFAGRFE
jgi:hypothetical protein